MKSISLSTGEWLLVKIPKGAYDFDIDEHLFFTARFMGHENIGQMKELPPGQWSIIGKPSELTIEDTYKIVEFVDYGDGEDSDVYLKNYKDGNFNLSTAKQSLLSLVESEGFEPETTLILKKII